MKRNDPCYCNSGRKYKKCCGSMELQVYDYLGVPVKDDRGDNPEGYGCMMVEFEDTTQTELMHILQGTHPESMGKRYHLMVGTEKGNYRFDSPQTVKHFRDTQYPNHAYLIIKVPELWEVMTVPFMKQIYTREQIEE